MNTNERLAAALRKTGDIDLADQFWVGASGDRVWKDAAEARLCRWAELNLWDFDIDFMHPPRWVANAPMGRPYGPFATKLEAVLAAVEHESAPLPTRAG